MIEAGLAILAALAVLCMIVAHLEARSARRRVRDLEQRLAALEREER